MPRETMQTDRQTIANSQTGREAGVFKVSTPDVPLKAVCLFDEHPEWPHKETTYL